MRAFEASVLLLFLSAAVPSQAFDQYYEAYMATPGTFGWGAVGMGFSEGAEAGSCAVVYDEGTKIVSVNAADMPGEFADSSRFDLGKAQKGDGASSNRYTYVDEQGELVKYAGLCSRIGGGDPTKVLRTLLSSRKLLSLQVQVECGKQFVGVSYACRQKLY